MLAAEFERLPYIFTGLSFSRPLRFTFQVAFWDALKTLDDGAARRAGSLARLMAHLVVRKQLSLTVLKVCTYCSGR